MLVDAHLIAHPHGGIPEGNAVTKKADLLDRDQCIGALVETVADIGVGHGQRAVRVAGDRVVGGIAGIFEPRLCRGRRSSVSSPAPPAKIWSVNLDVSRQR